MEFSTQTTTDGATRLTVDGDLTIYHAVEIKQRGDHFATGDSRDRRQLHDVHGSVLIICHELPMRRARSAPSEPPGRKGLGGLWVPDNFTGKS